MPLEKSSASSSITNQPPSTNTAPARGLRQRGSATATSAIRAITANGTVQPPWSPSPIPRILNGPVLADPNGIGVVLRTPRAATVVVAGADAGTQPGGSGGRITGTSQA